jgi:hypothetical protein
VRAKGRRRAIPPKQPLAAVKGQKYPPYGYVVRWNDPSAIAIFKYAITGKYKAHEGVYYRAEYRGIFYKTPGYAIARYDIPKNLDGLSRHDICFTMEEVERYITRHRMGHLHKHYYVMQKLNHEMETIANSMKWTADVLRSLGNDQIPSEILAKIQRRASKRVL